MAPQTSFFSSSTYSFSSSSFSYVWKYDVFLSFRGEDTRYGFTGYLYKALCDKGIHTFIDDEELQRGEEITPALVKAIEESRIAILVLSANYASSSFCLDELVKILECIKAKDRLVLPVFYKVDPSDVRHQRGSFGEAMGKHENRFKDDMDKVQKWKEALHQVANLSGYHFKYGDGYEHKFIGRIVQEISRKIRRVALPVADYPVGLESQVSKVTSLLDVESSDGVHMVGIYGIGGTGKTTLALAVYNLIADHFEDLCFLENVRENSNKYGLVYLQKILLCEILREKKIKIASIQQGTSIIQHRLRQKKVLLILDDVNEQKQLQATTGKLDWFGPGSRVIVTTRDKHLLACHGIERTYEVESLNKAESFELLIWRAFRSDIASPSYVDVLNRAVTYACGLPLALEVMGSNLFGKSVEDWESALTRYERIPNGEIQHILKISFDALEEDEQNIFLDIACCFKGYNLVEIKDIFHAHYERNMKYHIGVLVEKSLIKINKDDQVTLHDLIESMGKEIVRQESPKVPGKRSRLWFHEDIVQVLQNNQGTGAIEIIRLEFPISEVEENEDPPKKEKSKDVEVKWNGMAFKKMKNLKTLIIRNGYFSKVPKHLPNSLRVLEWWRYLSKCFPSGFHPKKLTILKLPSNNFPSPKLESLFKARNLRTLKVLKFDNSKYLTQIPNVAGLPNLQELSFSSCDNLITVHDSVGFLDKLKILNAKGCRKLRSFPPINLPSLEFLQFSKCSSLEYFPEILGNMENVTTLHLTGTGIKDLPFSFRNLSQLWLLSLNGNKNCRIPSVIVMMPKLAKINISRSGKMWPSLKQEEVEEIVSSMGYSEAKGLSLSKCNLSDDFFPLGLALFTNVKELDLSSNNFTILPECIKECRFLRILTVDDCPYLREIRGIPPNLECFSAINCKSWTTSCTSMLLNQELHEAGNTRFALPGSGIPRWFEHRNRGASISFWFRGGKFPAIALCLAIGLTDNYPCPVDVGTIVSINGKKGSRGLTTPIDQILLFDLSITYVWDNLDEATLLENEWNYAEVSYDAYDLYNETNVPIESIAKESGIHIYKQKNSVEDIRFTDPCKRRKLDDVLNIPEP